MLDGEVIHDVHEGFLCKVVGSDGVTKVWLRVCYEDCLDEGVNEVDCDGVDGWVEKKAVMG